jgi:hypothetical protein
MKGEYAMTATERTRLHRQRVRERGGATITVTLSQEARTALDALSDKNETSYVETINAALLAAAEGVR